MRSLKKTFGTMIAATLMAQVIPTDIKGYNKTWLTNRTPTGQCIEIGKEIHNRSIPIHISLNSRVNA